MQHMQARLPGKFKRPNGVRRVYLKKLKMKKWCTLQSKQLFFGTAIFLLLILPILVISSISCTKVMQMNFNRQLKGLEMKSQIQSMVMDEFCARNNLTHLKYTLPTHWKRRQTIFRHILVDDSERLLFAYLPKVASSHIRRFMCVLSGVLPVDSIYRDEISSEEHHACMMNSTFLRKDLNDTQRHNRLKNYWKVTILRNPLHRLVSAYRDKIVGLKRKPLNIEWSASIMKKYNKKSPDFESYLHWIVDTPNDQLNEHFAPMVEIIQPCVVGYHYYGNFKDISTEMSLIATRLKVPLKYFIDKDKYFLAHQKRTYNFVKSYASVSEEVKKALFWKFHKEFEFYYNLFPEESDSHVRYLGVHEHIDIYNIF